MSVKARLAWKGEAAVSAARAGGGNGIDRALAALLAASLQETPRDSGALAASAKASREGLQGAVSYDCAYAVRQHEDRELRHPNGGKAKFLEDPANSPGLRRRTLDELRAAVGTEMR